MKTFQPLTATEHLEQLYIAGHDWAQEAIDALDMHDEALDAIDLADDLAKLLGCTKTPSELYRLLEKVEEIMTERDQLKAKIALAVQELSGA